MLCVKWRVDLTTHACHDCVTSEKAATNGCMYIMLPSCVCLHRRRQPQRPQLRAWWTTHLCMWCAAHSRACTWMWITCVCARLRTRVGARFRPARARLHDRHGPEPRANGTHTHVDLTSACMWHLACVNYRKQKVYRIISAYARRTAHTHTAIIASVGVCTNECQIPHAMRRRRRRVYTPRMQRSSVRCALCPRWTCSCKPAMHANMYNTRMWCVLMAMDDMRAKCCTKNGQLFVVFFG